MEWPSSFHSPFRAHSSPPADWLPWASARVLGVKYAKPERAAVSLTGDGGFSANTSVIATAMEAKIPAVWVVMDNSAFGTIAGLEKAKYDWSFGCLFLRDGEPYSVDYPAVARAHGANGVDIKAADELGPALEMALQSDLPTVIRVPVENAPTPPPDTGISTTSTAVASSWVFEKFRALRLPRPS